MKQAWKEDKELIETYKQSMTKEEQDMRQTEMAMIIRNYWVYPSLFVHVCLSIRFLVQIKHLVFTIVLVSSTLIQILAIIISRFRHFSTCVQVCLWIDQITYWASLLVVTGIGVIKDDDANDINLLGLTFLIAIQSICVAQLIQQLQQKYKNLSIVIQIFGLIFVLAVRIYDWKGILANIKDIATLSVQFILFSFPFYLTDSKLQILRIKSLIRAAELKKEINNVREFMEEQNDVLQSLEEGIVVFSADTLHFANNVFEKIVKGVKCQDSKHITDVPLFKVFEQTTETQPSDVKNSSMEFSSCYSSDLQEHPLSLRDLLKKAPAYFTDKIFEIMVPRGSCESDVEFKYVQIKSQNVKKTSEKCGQQRVMLQFIDVSSRMLYNEVKAKQEFLTLINATVSHELRNPLTSLLTQITLMGVFMACFENTLESMQVGSEISADLIKTLRDVFEGIKSSSQKLSSASKFIEFFVHDILDYTVLNKDAHKFIKNMEVFNIKKAMAEILEMLDDKIAMKAIAVSSTYIGLDIQRKQLVKTDQKRLQQIVLNLVSNAVKFTNANGSIAIRVEFLNNEKLRVEVKDSGIGIRDEDQPKLFKMFGSIKDEKNKINTKGIGLGLVISRLLVEKFGGQIGFESKFGEGTTFSFTFETQDFDILEVNQANQESQPAMSQLNLKDTVS